MTSTKDRVPELAIAVTAPEPRLVAEPLRGGRTTLGVVKIGETVRRPATPNSVFVRSLLRHLQRSGFMGAPRYLGTDEDHRDVFSYLPGDVPAELGEHKDQEDVKTVFEWAYKGIGNAEFGPLLQLILDAETGANTGSKR